MNFGLIAASLALTAVSASQSAFAKSGTALTFVSAEEIVNGQDWNRDDCCDNTCPPQNAVRNDCSCKKGQVLIGYRPNTESPQVWSCITLKQNDCIKCPTWYGYCGFCQSNEVRQRPNCSVPDEAFDIINDFPATDGATRYLTVDLNGFAFIDILDPLSNNCANTCCANESPVCARRSSTLTFNDQPDDIVTTFA
jgi:hypothetical protein